MYQMYQMYAIVGPMMSEAIAIWASVPEEQDDEQEPEMARACS